MAILLGAKNLTVEAGTGKASGTRPFQPVPVNVPRCYAGLIKIHTSMLSSILHGFDLEKHKFGGRGLTMGFRVQLIAVTGKEPCSVQHDFRVVATGQREEVPESPVVGTALPNGAYLLYINDRDKIVPEDKVFARLSKGASLVACYANETVMTSFACSWANGVERWTVFHDAQQDIRHLETSGVIPPEFLAIRDRLFARQEGDDGDTDFIFAIPVELFAALGGIRYDRDIPGAGPTPWEILDSQT